MRFQAAQVESWFAPTQRVLGLTIEVVDVDGVKASATFCVSMNLVIPNMEEEEKP